MKDSEKKSLIQRAINQLVKTFQSIFEVEQSVSMSQIYDQIYLALSELDEWVWLNDVYTDEQTGSIFALVSKEGLLFTIPVTVRDSGVTLGEMVQVRTQFEPVRTSFSIKQSKDGTTRWFLMASSTVLNRNGKLNSKEFFDNLIKNSESSGVYPYLTFFHLGRSMEMGVTDWVAREENILMASGTFHKDNLVAEAMIGAYERDPQYWGSSICFWPTEMKTVTISQGIEIPVFADGEFEEISVLPENQACCLFTALRTDQRIGNMEKSIAEAIKKLAGNDDLAAQFIQQVDDANRTISEQGLVHMSAETPVIESPVEEEAAAAPEPVVSADREIEIDDELVSTIVQQLSLNPSVTGLINPVRESVDGLSTVVQGILESIQQIQATLASQVKVVEKRVEQLETPEAQKKQEWLNDLPRGQSLRVTHRARAQEDSPEAETSYNDIAAETLAKIK